MKALIIEDEKAAVRNLMALLGEVDPDIEVIDVLDSITDSVEWFQSHPMPELIFLDIHLADGSAFEIFGHVDISCPIIFTTAYDEYALKAFKVNSVDYLLKPIMTEEMESALRHVTEILKEERGNYRAGEMDLLEKQLFEIRSAREHVSVMVAQAIDYVSRNLNKNITLADVCNELLVSTGHFSKCFKKETGVGFAAYVTMVKMENARILLKNPQNRVNEVARMLGYSDYAYFFQVFKKQFGYAPSDIKTSGKRDKEDKDENSDAGE